MHSIHAEKVSLTFPLYQRTSASETEAHPIPFTEDDRLILGKDGRILAVKALRDITFTLKGGDRLALIGKNGSGKTTLLQVLAGIYPPDAGYVATRGRATNLINLNLGMRSEATGHRNITLKGLAAGRSREEIEEKRNQIAEFSELGRFLDMPVETYSAGMRMRLSFAIATAFDPEILILDEWISAGDAAFKQKASQRMQEFVGKAGILILASHSPDLLIENCSRGIWLDKGRIRFDGPIRDALEAYAAETRGAAQKPRPANRAGPAPVDGARARS
ncbi:MAG: ATP-binding cassette domain-containing protein [Alphaproteobacteria bacterium]|nr:ATP-binding cassette domain-containing protein [Alphaproteobacteria bacterium]